MSRVRVSTTVDGDLLSRARQLRVGATDAVLLDEALTALLARHRREEIDAAYDRGYGEHPYGEPDEWGSLVEWHEALGRARR